MADESIYAIEQTEHLGDKSTGIVSASRSNALANKLSSILTASYADTEIRDALHTLDQGKVTNTPETRRRLRIDTQKEVIDRNSDVIFDFGQVAEQLKRIGSTITSLNQHCENIKLQVAAARRENAPVLEEADLLLGQKRDFETKKLLLGAFTEHFMISEDELTALTSTSEGVDEGFFTILQRIKGIYRDCEVLLGGENQRLGMELMEQCSRNLNLGYQKLFKWIQKELKNLNLENPQINRVIRRALRALSERPTLFQRCLDFFAEARERVLTDAFYSALTGAASVDGENQMMKPIEFHAHEPLRYVGDMLAWTHSATVSEREALENLFVSEGEEFKKGFEAGRGTEPWSVGEGEDFDGQKALSDLINRDVGGIAKALRQRIEQVLQNHEDPVLLYKISNLVNFYDVTFQKLLGPDSSLHETLEALQESALRQFRTILRETASSVNNDLSTPPSDLEIPEFFDECLTQLSELLKSYDASLAPLASRVENFRPIVQSAFDPFLSACEKMAQKVEEPDNRIFLTNCLIAAQTTFSKQEFVQDRRAELAGQLADCTSNLTEYQHAFFLHTSGLHPLLAALAPVDDSEESLTRARALPALQAAPLSDAGQILDDFLHSALIDALDNLKRLSSKAVAQEITAEAAERFCEDFEYVEGKLLAIDKLEIAAREERGSDEEDSGGAEGEKELLLLKSLFPRTSGEIRVLLS